MKWGQTEIANWLGQQMIKRSYLKDVVTKIQALSESFGVIEYGRLSHASEKYPLYILKSKNFDPKKKTVLITGGVHGYETSGVHGALEFLKRAASGYEGLFNFICAPCVSPWAYETINRWNTKALDPNRNFRADSPVEESRLLMKALTDLNVKPFVHIDLHETTDTDNTVFRLALQERDGTTFDLSDIPDGFYAVGASENPQPEFQKAVIDEVRKVTHIAPPDANGQLIGEPLEQEGVINYAVKSLFLCAGLTEAEYVTTTEVYPDSPKVTDEICIEAQVAAIRGGLDYVARRLRPG